jgi:hypothetical protein
MKEVMNKNESTLPKMKWRGGGGSFTSLYPRRDGLSPKSLNVRWIKLHWEGIFADFCGAPLLASFNHSSAPTHSSIAEVK